MTPSVVVFDLGKVLVDFDYTIAATRIAARSRLTLPEIGKMLGSSPLLLQLETGLLSSEEFFDTVHPLIGFDGTFEEFAQLFGDIFSEIPAMIQFHASLRARGIPTYVFSNTSELAVRHIHKHFPFFHNFNGYIYSYQHRSMKPHARIYEVVEEQTGRRGSEIFYIDDRPENVAAGAGRGWQTCVHQNPTETVAAARKIGLPAE